MQNLPIQFNAMRRPLVVSLLTALALFCSCRQGFPQILPFDYYSIKDGLASNWITSIFQDSRGYLWIGGDGGLSVYDGISFKTYGVDDGLPIGFVWCFAESRQSPGTIYVGTNGGGLCKLVNGKFSSTLLKPQPSLVELSQHNAVHAIFEDDEGRVWCGTNRGIYHLRGDSVSFFFAGPDSGWVGFIGQTPDGRIWFNAKENLYTYSPPTRAVEQFELNIGNEVFSSFFADDEHTVWIGTSGGTIYKICDNRIVAARHAGLSAIESIVGDREGNLWINTDGLLKIAQDDFAEGEFTRYTTENGLLDNALGASFLDRENNLWFGSRRAGLHKLSERHLMTFPFTSVNLLPDVLNQAAAADAHNHLFVATEKGLWEIWKNRNGSWEKFIHPLPDLAARADKKRFAYHNSVAVSKEGMLWHVIHGGGLAGYKITEQPNQPSRLTFIKKLVPGRDLPEGNPLGITIDRNNQLWYVIWQYGVVQIDLGSLQMRADYPNAKAEFDGTPQDVLQDFAGRMWISTFSGDIHIFEPEGGAYRLRQRLGVENGLASDRVRALLQRHNGEIWIGHRYNGISIYKNGRFENLTTRDGLLNNAVWALAEDTEGRVWIGTSAGLQYTAPNDSRRLFTQRQLVSGFTEGVGIIAGEKTVWALSAEALTLYEYGHLAPKSPPPPVYLTGLRVNGKERSLQNKLKFSHNENLCALLFSGVSFKSQKALQYKYRLRGLDDSWQGPTNQSSVTFASLQPGVYTFEVIAINADTVESTAPASLTFTIAPPFWQRWWFIVFCVLILGSILYAVHVVRLDRLLAIEKIRARIATDLHDDIGAGLTHIGLLSQVALHKKDVQQFYSNDKAPDAPAPAPDLQTAAAAIHELGGSVERMGGVARELSAAMSDVVWSINPQHDSGEALQRRLSVFAHEICRAKNIALNFEVSKQMAGMKLHPELRRSLLLIVKEALHNAVKYSGSPSVSVNIALKGKNIVAAIADCGKGFEINNSSTGNGLNNMRSRAEKLGGTCEIVSAPGQGTRVAATVPYKKG
jgi:signal transduction histidine kinase/ligand-binding sensor domain-containing protein